MILFDYMAKKKNKIIVKTNLDTATPEQKENFMKLLVEAHRILYRSVVDRYLSNTHFGRAEPQQA